MYRRFRCPGGHWHRDASAAYRSACLLLLRRVDRRLQGRASREFWSFRRSDLDRFAGCRIAAFTSSAFRYGEGAEAGDAYRVAFFQTLGDDGDQSVHCTVGGSSGHFSAFRKFCNQFAFFHYYLLGYKSAQISINIVKCNGFCTKQPLLLLPRHAAAQQKPRVYRRYATRAVARRGAKRV